MKKVTLTNFLKHLLLFVLLTSFTQALLATPSNGQAVGTVSLDLKNASLPKVFTQIEQQTDYKFSYNEDEVQGIRLKRLQFKKEELAKVLDYLETQANVQFKLVNKLIGVKVKRKPTTPKLHSTGDSEAIKELIFNIPVTGKVTDAATGEPLVGATVQVKGTNVGTQTDAEGNFSLSIPENTPRLVVSYLGFATQEIAVGNQTSFNIQLQTDATAIQEVVVVGYGTQKRADTEGSVTSITSNTINKFPSTSLEQSLIGNVPGVHIVQSSGAPGAGISVRVRGVTSIAGGNEPLYVIDGVPFFNSDVRGLNGLSTINPNDIESIEILKDAAATAIYGSRGGNGVVLITTKMGKGKTFSVNYNAWASMDEPVTKIDVMNGAEFTEYANIWSKNSNRPIPNANLKFLGADTDWQDEIMGVAYSQNHNLNFSGGNDYTRYYVSFGYLNQDGVVNNSNLERYSVRANMNNTLTERVTIQTSILGTRAVQNGVVPAQNNNTFSVSKTAVSGALWSIPTIPIRDSTGAYSAINDFVENSVLYVKEVLDKSTVNQWLASSTVKVDLFKGLTNNTRLGMNYTHLRKDMYFPRSMRIVLGGNGAAILQNRENFNYVVENFLEYKNQIANQLVLEAIAGASLQKETTNFTNNEGTNFISDDLKNNAIQAAQSAAIPTTSTTEQSIASAFGRVRFIFKDKYILASSIRRDGASVFSENNKIATFPSVSFGWKVSEEGFLKGSSLISNLKLRASWGKSGNPAIQPYQSLPLGLLNTTSQGAGTGLVIGLASNLPNRNLTWETTTQTNAGLDFGLFNNRITGTFDYYLKQTEGALSTVQLAPSAGFNTIVDNVGEVENQGLELSMNAFLVDVKDFNLSVGFNVSLNRNKVTKTKNNQDLIETLSSSNGGGEIYNAIRVGEELGAFLGYKFTGFNDTGVPQYQDVNNDGKSDASDFVIIGSPFPDMFYGVNTNLNYKNFSLYANLQGVTGNDVYNVMEFFLTDPNDVDANRMANICDYYPNPNVNLVHRASDRYIEDASYVRLGTLRLGYSLPIVNSVVKGIDFYLSGQNLFTITDYKGYDPEVNSLNGNTLTQGIDLSTYPSVRSYTFGLNLKF